MVQLNLFVAHERRSLSTRTCAQRPEIRVPIRQRDHGVRPSVLFPIERRGFCRVEPAILGILRVVEPESNVKSMRWEQARSWVKTEDLIQQNGLDRHFRISVAIGLDVCLVPCQAEVLEL